MLSNATIQELRQIILEDYGQEISMTEASEIANDLVGYFDLLAKIYHRNLTQNKYDDNRQPSATNAGVGVS
jgi:hypothetical protein